MPDGTFYSTRDVEGNQQENKQYNAAGDLVQSSVTSKGPTYLTPIVNALMAAAGGAVLGPAGAGLLSTPAAAATAAGGTSLARGGSAEDALKAAVLAGITAGATEGLLGGSTAAPSDFVAADVAQLAAQGIPEEQIAQILTQEGVSSKIVNAALDAQFGTSTAGSAKGLGDFSTTAAAESVPVMGTGLFNPASVVAPAVTQAVATLPSAPSATQSVEVSGQPLQNANVTIQDLLSVLTPAITSTLPAPTGGVQSVEVTGTKEPQTTENIISSLVPAVVSAVPAVTNQVVTQPATQSIEVTGTKDTTLLPTLPPAVTSVIPSVPAAVTTELPKPLEPTVKPDNKSLFTPSDILKVLNLIGGLAAGGAAVRNTGNIGVGSLPPSDTMLGSTTPQFGPDYYAAVQQYYNAYMPETPRNVAGPLQQWYENKYGA